MRFVCTPKQIYTHLVVHSISELLAQFLFFFIVRSLSDRFDTIKHNNHAQYDSDAFDKDSDNNMSAALAAHIHHSKRFCIIIIIIIILSMLFNCYYCSFCSA